ncbi:MAG: hypothetical protein P4L82_21305, partial [Ancalomicrobiaceae bacterium]|nr:hypothetical protein [Ancalomicrobiaceae bacterium]
MVFPDGTNEIWQPDGSDSCHAPDEPTCRHCERSEAIQKLQGNVWIASLRSQCRNLAFLYSGHLTMKDVEAR